MANTYTLQFRESLEGLAEVQEIPGDQLRFYTGDNGYVLIAAVHYTFFEKYFVTVKDDHGYSHQEEQVRGPITGPRYLVAKSTDATIVDLTRKLTEAGHTSDLYREVSSQLQLARDKLEKLTEDHKKLRLAKDAAVQTAEEFRAKAAAMSTNFDKLADALGKLKVKEILGG